MDEEAAEIAVLGFLEKVFQLDEFEFDAREAGAVEPLARAFERCGFLVTRPSSGTMLEVRRRMPTPDSLREFGQG